MATMAFDSLRYARRLREVGVPEPQAEVQAELMAEAFGFYAENILTRDHFTEVLNARFAEFGAKIDQRFAEQDAKFDALESRMEKRFSEQDAKFDALESRMEKRFSEQDAKFDALESRLEKRFVEQDGKRASLEARIEKRFDEQTLAFEQRFAPVERNQYLMMWMLGVMFAVLVIPQLHAWLT
jgi:hypothetical protein